MPLRVVARSRSSPARWSLRTGPATTCRWLIFLQGGPGGKSPRPTGPASGGSGQALKTHRVLLLDQRGTGRSTPISGAHGGRA